MIFQFGYCSIFFLYFIHDMSISISIHLFIYCNPMFRISVTSLAMNLSGKCSLDLVHLLRNTPSFGGWKIHKKTPKNTLDVLTIFQFFHFSLVSLGHRDGSLERHASPGARVLHAFITVFPTAGRPGLGIRWVTWTTKREDILKHVQVYQGSDMHNM